MLVTFPAHTTTDSHEHLLEAFTQLKDVQLRSKWETDAGVYLAESHNVIERALTAGHRPLAFLLAPRWLSKLEPLLSSYTGSADGGDIPVFLASEQHTEQITGFTVHRGALGLFARPPAVAAEEILDTGGQRRAVAVLEGLVDHTNVGALFRSAAALGISGILITPDCADPLYRRSVRVSMGAVFQIPWARLDRWPSPALFSDHNFLTVALTPNPPARDLDAYLTRLAGKENAPNLALLLGSEGPGLRAQTIAASDVSARIPLATNVDSLNVATAGALAFWEAHKYAQLG